MLRSRHLVVTVISVPGFKELEPTTHITVSYNHYQARQNLPNYRRSQQHTQQKGNNCNISIVGKNSNVPQVAPRTTRERPYLHCHLSYTKFFFSVESQELVSPGKGGVKEMPVQNDSIIYCIKYTKPQKEQNLLTFIQYNSRKRIQSRKI